MTAPHLKICGLARREDAVIAADAGASYLGAIFAAESPRAVTAAQAGRMLAGLAPRRVGVFVNSSTRDLVDTAATAGLHVLQLHGEESPAQLRELRGCGEWALWKAVRVREPADFAAAIDRFAPWVDGLLLDTWSPSARGGTGSVFPWEEVAVHRDRLPAAVALIAAGGLRADNLARAVALLRPATVDISSGVESAPGIKDPAAIRAVVRTLRSLSTDKRVHDGHH
ncbi:MAG: phosphoribosylanthranilate isomerase [Gemmatimonadetes bacterium]|nr:phosphoribosylanthranilate isomerase [Gemmatimonadota bacterium]